MDLRIPTAESQAYDLGELLASSFNKEEETGVVGAIDYARRQDYREQIESLSNVYGPEIDKYFAEGFDSIIDFSLNADWRLIDGNLRQ